MNISVTNYIQNWSNIPLWRSTTNTYKIILDHQCGFRCNSQLIKYPAAVKYSEQSGTILGQYLSYLKTTWSIWLSQATDKIWWSGVPEGLNTKTYWLTDWLTDRQLQSNLTLTMTKPGEKKCTTFSLNFVYP